MPKLAVLGMPVSHSRSPAMHNAALTALGLAPEWSYEAIEVTPEDFPRLIATLPGDGFAGVNVTVPHKVAALAEADRASDAARAIGAANTLSFDRGLIAAANTDIAGILGPLPRAPGGLRALVLGAGGAARAAIWALIGAGADVHVWNRTRSKAADLAEELGARLAAVPLATGDWDLILNATTVGMAAEGQPPGDSGAEALKGLPIDADALGAEQLVVDLVYGTHETDLIAAARARGASVVDGLDVLVHQGAAALHLWTGAEPPLEVMRAAVREAP